MPSDSDVPQHGLRGGSQPASAAETRGRQPAPARPEAPEASQPASAAETRGRPSSTGSARRWAFPPASAADENGIVGVGADLAPATLIAAYRRGLFPMPLKPEGRIAWWSPPERGVLELEDLVVHRSLRRSCRRYEVRMDTAFADVVAACADRARAHGWIDSQMCRAYTRLHRAGFAHSVEAWSGDQLVGGLYGVAVGGLFAGESMFSRARDASKVSLVALVDALRDGCPRLIDVQWLTPHLRSLGATAISRDDYLSRLPELLASPPPVLFTAAQPQP